MELIASAFIANYSASGKARRVTHNGRDFIVAPMTLLVSGVLNGSKGALYYPLQEIAATYDAWNGFPIVVNHPFEMGRPVSARSPQIIEKYGIGHLYSAEVRGGKLIAEGWFDVEKTRKVDQRILNALERGQKIELSTGLFTDNHPAPAGATYNGRRFEYIARNYRPDHLAILPDSTGACSIEDGCGVLVNKQGETVTDNESGCGCDHKKAHTCSCDTCKEKQKMKLTANQRKQMVTALVANSGVYSKDDEDVLNDFDDAKLSRLHEKLVGNEMEEEEEEAVVPPPAKKKAPAVPVDEEEEVVPVGNAKAPVITKAQVLNALKGMTPAEYYEFAPTEVKAAIRSSVKVTNERKTELLNQLTANVADEEQKKIALNVLKGKDIEELETLLMLAPAQTYSNDNPFRPTANYAGNAGAGPTMNSGRRNTKTIDDKERREDVLLPPTINWKDETEKVG